MAPQAKNSVITQLVLYTVTGILFLLLRVGQGVLFFKNFVSYLLLPGPSAAHVLITSADTISRGLGSLARMQEENRILREKLDELNRQKFDYENLVIENMRLYELLRYESLPSHQFVPARVIGQLPLSKLSYILVNKGIRHGIYTDCPVLVYQDGMLGVVGRVIESAQQFSKVLLISDESSRLAVRIVESRHTGVLSGRDENTLTIQYLPPKAKINPGDLVVTSGQGRIFPRDLVIGRIRQVKDERWGLHKTASVSPHVDFHRVEDVLVLINYAPLGEEEKALGIQ